MALEEVGVRAVVQGVGTYVQDANRVSQATHGIGKAAGQAAGAFDVSFKGILRTAGAVALGMGGLSLSITGTRTALQSTIGAAIEFESSFAGIRKTVDATEEEFGQLASLNRRMAREIPVSVNEINRIGELAGQLGVRGVENIAKFERTVADLAITTDLTADSAATSFAQIANIMELPISNVDRLGAAVVDLGNKSATTESRIVEFALRIGGAGKIAGLTVDQIAGIGAAFASAGLEAEAGGTAIQKVLLAITEAAATGGKELEVFAETAGMTAVEFRALAKGDPAQAFVRFVEGLGTAGDRAFKILEDLGLTDQRLIRSFLSVANSGDLLARTIRTGTEAFAENTALTEEAEKRYATTASQLRILKNNVLDLGISLGTSLTPAIRTAAQGSAGLAQALAVLGPTLRTGVTAAIAFAAALALINASLRAQALLSSLSAANTGLVTLQTSFTSLSGATLVSTGLMGQMRFASMALGSALMTPVGAAAALTVAFIGLDLIMRQVTGGGLIAYLTGATASARAAEEATRKYGDQLQRVNRLVTAGLTPEQARARVIADITANLERLAGVVALAEADPFRAFEAAAEQGGVRQVKADLEALRKEIEALELSWPELNRIVADSPVLQRLLSDELARAKEAYDAVLDQRDIDRVKRYGQAWREQHGLVQGTGEEAEDAAVSFEALGDAVSALADVLQRPSLDRLQIETEIARLERLKAKAGEAFGADNQRQLDLYKIRLAQLEGVAEETERQFQILGVRLRESLSAEELTANLETIQKEIIKALPAEQRITVLFALNRLSVQQVLSIIDLLARGVSVPVAFAAGALGTSPAGRILAQLTGLPIIGGAFGGALGRAGMSLLSDALAGLNLDAAGFADAADKAGASAGAAADKIDALADGVITLEEALAEGISARQAAVMELLKAEQDAASQTFRTEVEMAKLDRILGTAGLAGQAAIFHAALLDLGQGFRQAGESVTQFLSRLATSALDATRAAFDALFQRPTRETLGLQLQLAQLERTRLQRIGSGATSDDLKDLDRQIEKVRNLIALREKEFEILRLRTQLADRTLQTDRDLLTQAGLLATAMGEQSAIVRDLNAKLFFETMAHLNAANAANQLADALRGTASAAGGVPQAQHGLVGDFGSGTLAMLHGREAVIPLRGGVALLPPGLPAQTFSNTFSPTLVQEGIDADKARALFHRWVDEMFTGARSRAVRAGSPLSSGIG